ncbi:hypothetical protein [Acidipila rosea]|uniref:Uncharacterized protein n=1 Tax=Acidipila rosea TaxID=768535 RepID=A0A4R1L9U3_9BACT|nr:hypothetical protein [Acidipila rosea]TCK74040.1 hypothetical protein C7378_1660 [Acidipila rosea]
MSPAATRTLPARKPAKRKKKQGGPGLLVWLPVIAGIAITPLTVRAAGVMAMSGPGALRLLYPYVVLLQTPVLGLPAELASNLSQLMMYLQFPIYGLLAMLTMRSRSWVSGLGSAIFMHFAAVFVLFLMAHM